MIWIFGAIIALGVIGAIWGNPVTKLRGHPRDLEKNKADAIVREKDNEKS